MEVKLIKCSRVSEVFKKHSKKVVAYFRYWYGWECGIVQFTVMTASMQSRSLHLHRAASRAKDLKQLQRGLVTARHENDCPLFGFLTIFQQDADAQRDFTDFHFHEHRRICPTPLQMLTCPSDYRMINI